MKRLAVILLVALSAAGQVRESVTVEVIEVPVYVSTAAGEPIRALPREAFKLFVNRKEQPIEYFDAVDFAATTAAAAGATPDLRQRRLYLLLFDLCFAKPGKLARAQRAAAALVAKSNPSTDSFAVASYTSSKGVQFASAFLSDRVAVRRAIETLAVGELKDPLGVGVSAAERAAWLDSSVAAADLDVGAEIAAISGGAGEGRAASNAALATTEMAAALRGGIANGDNAVQPVKRLIEYQVDNLADVAARLTALEGQKHVIFFSEGFDSGYVNNPFSGMIARSSAGAKDRTINLIQSMSHVFQTAGVFLDTVDVAGMRMARDAFEESLQILAHGTGGEFVHNENDLAAGLQTLTNRQAAVYILGFQRRNDSRGTINVEISGLPHGARVTFRPGFGPPREHGEVDPLRVADVLVNDIPQTAFRVGTRHRPAPGGADLEFALWPKEIKPQIVEKTPYVDAVLYVFDSKGATVLVHSKRVKFDKTRSDEPVVLREHLQAAPGTYTAKAVVRIAGSEALGFARTDFTVE